MNEENTLFLLARFGVKMGKEHGCLESRMWLLEPNEIDMKYVSLHKTKADRAYKGGEIVDILDATPQEIEAHQALMEKEGHGRMEETLGRKVIVFRLDRKWNKLWPESGKANPMAYKARGYVPE